MPDLQKPSLTTARAFFHRHALSAVAGAVMLLWVVLYFPANPDTHWGSFFGNAIADWSGVVATVICTRILYERGSPDCKRRIIHEKNPIVRWIKTHTGDLDRRICAHVRDFEMGASGGQCGVRVDPDPGTDLAHEAVRRRECRAGSGPSRGASLNVATAANASIGSTAAPRHST